MPLSLRCGANGIPLDAFGCQDLRAFLALEAVNARLPLPRAYPRVNWFSGINDVGAYGKILDVLFAHNFPSILFFQLIELLLHN